MAARGHAPISRRPGGGGPSLAQHPGGHGIRRPAPDPRGEDEELTGVAGIKNGRGFSLGHHVTDRGDEVQPELAEPPEALFAGRHVPGLRNFRVPPARPSLHHGGFRARRDVSRCVSTCRRAHAGGRVTAVGVSGAHELMDDTALPRSASSAARIEYPGKCHRFGHRYAVSSGGGLSALSLVRLQHRSPSG